MQELPHLKNNGEERMLPVNRPLKNHELMSSKSNLKTQK
jgi:hypothetical protein